LTQYRALAAILRVRTSHARTQGYITNTDSAERLLITYEELQDISNAAASRFDLWNSLYERSRYNDALLSRLLRTAHIVMLSVEESHLNSLVDTLTELQDPFVKKADLTPAQVDERIRNGSMVFLKYLLQVSLFIHPT
jgi:hypothetical protein